MGSSQLSYLFAILIVVTTTFFSSCSASPILNDPLPYQHPEVAEYLAYLSNFATPTARKLQMNPQEIRDRLDEFINNVTKCHNMFAASVSLVLKQRQGNFVFTGGYGFTDPEKKRPADEFTLYGIGSTSKAFTALIAAMLVDEQKLDWNTPISKYLPNFKFYDSITTQKATLLDIIAHRTGVPRNDILWISGPNGTREDWVNKLQYFPPNFDFRNQWQYNNWMLMLAGYVTEKVTGNKWEDLVAERIFKELSMNEGTTTSVTEAIETNNYAHPLGYLDGEWQPFPEDVNKVIEVICPAGCINSNAVDMAKWMTFQLSNGTFNGKQLISPLQLSVTHSPHATLGALSGYAKPGFPFSDLNFDYDLGWIHGTYQGYKKIWHSGGTLGHTTLVTLFPEANIGVFISGTGGKSPVQVLLPELAITYFATDILLGVEPWITPKIACNFSYKRTEKIKVENRRSEARKIKNAAEYVGSYYNPGYGTFTVTQRDPQPMRFFFNQFSGFLLPTSEDNTFDLQSTSLTMSLVFGTGYIPYFVSFIESSGNIVASIPLFEPNFPPTFVKQ